MCSASSLALSRKTLKPEQVRF